MSRARGARAGPYDRTSASGRGSSGLRRRPPAADGEAAKPDFMDRLARGGDNITKIGGGTNPRDTAGLIAAQARSAVEPPMLQAVGPQAVNQATKAIIISRTYLQLSEDVDIAFQPEFMHLDESLERTGVCLYIVKKARRTASTDKDATQMKVASDTEAKALAGALAQNAREGKRVILTAIGAGCVNQAVKGIAIARSILEEECVDLSCRPEFVELPGEGGRESLSAIKLLVLTEQC